MANYSENDFATAQRIINNLLNKYLEGNNIISNVPIADIETDTENFTNDLDFLKQLGSEMPAMRIGEELIPIALRHFSELNNFNVPFPYGDKFPRSFWWYEWEHVLKRLYEKKYSDTLSTLSIENARTTFERLATEFLANRISYINNSTNKNNKDKNLSWLNVPNTSRGASIYTPGCTFSVTSNSIGLRVFWSGAYCISPKYFGSPTSPTISTLQSGTFVFGVDGGAYGNQVQWDQNAIVSLPGNSSVHLNF